MIPRGMHGAVLRHLAEVGQVDLRKVSEPFRQRPIDLVMMDPPLVDVDADRVFLTDAGKHAATCGWIRNPAGIGGENQQPKLFQTVDPGSGERREEWWCWALPSRPEHHTDAKHDADFSRSYPLCEPTSRPTTKPSS